MKKARPLNEINSLSKVSEISLCSAYNPPANGFKTFDIIKGSIKKDEYSDLFEELQAPEYGDFTSYLATWLEQDVNMVAYSAFLDALFCSLQDVCYDSSLDKAGKLTKFKENFDSFIKEYENSVITKSTDGKVKLNINKSEEVNIKKYYEECVCECNGGDKRTFTEIVQECAPNRINNSLWDMFTWKLQDKIYEIHYLNEEDYTKEQKAAMITELFAEFVKTFNETELIKSNNKQETKVKDSILKKLQNFVAELTKAEEKPEVQEEPKDQETPTEEPTTEEPEVQEPEQPETPVEPVTVIESEEPTQKTEEVESPEEVEEPAEEAEEVQEPEQPEAEEVEEPTEEPTVEEVVDDEITKAQTKIGELEQQVIDLQKAQAEQTVKLEKAELSKEIEKDYIGLPKTKDEIVEALYEISKSQISEESKTFIKESLKSLSDLNKESFDEVGHSEEVDVNKSAEEILNDKIKKTMQENDILEEQALLVVTEGRSIEKAKEVTAIVRKRK